MSVEDPPMDDELATQAGPRFAEWQMHVFPVDMRLGEDGKPAKTPLPGFMWKQRATTDVREVIDDVIEAESIVGAGNVGIGWALGLDDYVALDLDAEEPEWWRELSETAVNVTSRGEHRIYAMPSGRRIGNGLSKFPTQGWGEVRGAGGYIVVWWPGDRPGFDVTELGKIVVFPRPDWLSDAGEERPGVSYAQLEAFRATHTDGDVRRIRGFVTKLNDRAPGTSRNHWATVVACWIVREAAAGLVPAAEAFAALEAWWAQLPETEVDVKTGILKTRRLSEREIRRIECWAIGQLTAENVEETQAKAADHPPALTVDCQPGDEDQQDHCLPDRFWSRPNHAAVRDAAFGVGVSPEALMLVVIAAVAAHIPAAVVFPGKRRGVPNLLAGVVGTPGRGKGTTLDRALELVPPPPNAKRFKPGTAQGLVKQFYELVPSDPSDPKSAKVLRRHTHPVILRVDEIAKFTAATGKSEHGQNFIAEIKAAVFGEALGQSVATDDKNLGCDARSYRLVGMLGVAPGVAGPLFDDVDGGLPQRLLFAKLLRADQQPDGPLAPFDDMTDDDSEAWGGAQYAPLPRLRWNPPQGNAFADSEIVAKRVAEMNRVGWDLLDAHVPYLAHAVAAVLAYLDGRWLIQPVDLTLAGDVVDISRAVRSGLLDGLARSAATGAREKRQQRIDEAVATSAAVHAQQLDLDLLDYARRIVASVRAWHDEHGKWPTVRDLSRNANDRGAWQRGYEEALARNWLREELQPTGTGGSARRAVLLTEDSP
jgi:hypothetical protein